MLVPKYTTVPPTKGTERPQHPVGSHWCYWEPQLPRTPERQLRPPGDEGSCHQPQQMHLRSTTTEDDTQKPPVSTFLIPGRCQGFGCWPTGKHTRTVCPEARSSRMTRSRENCGPWPTEMRFQLRKLLESPPVLLPSFSQGSQPEPINFHLRCAHGCCSYSIGTSRFGLSFSSPV